MKRLLALGALALCFAATAIAQQYRWVDQNGRVQYGDTPPPGVKATPMRGPSGPAAPSAPADAASKAAPARPLTPAEQEAAYRKRQMDAQKAADKEASVERDAATKRENCSRAQAYLRSLESGQRQVRVDAQGERYYLEDAEIARETTKTRQDVQRLCAG
jgi:hypothetical protein